MESIADDFLNKPSPEDLARATATARAEAGGAWTATPAGGGDDAAASAALTAMYEAIGSEIPAQATGRWSKAHETVSEVLRDYCVASPEIAREAGKAFGQTNVETPHFVNPYLSSFPGAFGIYVGKAKKAADDAPDDRRARYDTPAVRASQVALEERKAAKPPPAKDDKFGKVIKAEIELQMSKATFDVYVKPAGFVCDDGALTVTAPDAFIKGWLTDRLATTIRRTAVGVLGGAVEVRFEVAGRRRRDDRRGDQRLQGHKPAV